MLEETWGGVEVAVHDELIDASALPALIASLGGQGDGLLTYRVGGDAWEIVTLDALIEDQGIGSALIRAVRKRARNAGARRLWLITTNDNMRAIRFYQRRGFDLVALHRDAVTRARALKPGIPREHDGIALRHELEFEMVP
ncbi:MAG: GNAT family N-acetyltransferase [Hamadaea sp.]|nr:GNAT family N-acetyltransferase [Hamadaea sp.]